MTSNFPFAIPNRYNELVGYSVDVYKGIPLAVIRSKASAYVGKVVLLVVLERQQNFRLNGGVSTRNANISR